MSSKPMWLWMLIGSSFLFLMVWEQIQSVRLGYEVETLRAKTQGQEQKNAYLRLELERLRAPQSLAMAARARLKMAPPNPESVIIMQAAVSESSARLMPSLLSRLFFPSREQH